MKRTKRLISFLLCAALFLCIFTATIPTAYAYSPAYALPALTGNQAQDTANIAVSQLGYTGAGGTVYGAWWNSVTNWGVDYTYSAWCAMFACWCANKAGAGLNTAYNKNGASAALLFEWYKNNATADTAFSLTPAAGDFIFFGTSSGTVQHVAVVTGYTSATKRVAFVGGNQGKVSGGTVTSSAVTYAAGTAWGSQYVLGIGRAKYQNTAPGDHVCDKGTLIYYGTTHPHNNYYRCSICKNEWRDTASSNFVESCLECHRPGKPALVLSGSEFFNDETITFTWESTANTTHYNFWLYKLDEEKNDWVFAHRQDYATSGKQLKLDPGKYRAWLYSYNSDYWEANGGDWLRAQSADTCFTVVPRICTITLDPCGGACDQVSISAAYGAAIGALPVPTRSGYQFDGWYSERNGSGTKYTSDMKFQGTADATWYANWICQHTECQQTVIPPTCTQWGYTACSCQNCSYTWKQNYIRALGHGWNGGVVTTQPTATTDGVRTYTCTRCGATRTEAIPATGGGQPEQTPSCNGGAACPGHRFTDMPAPGNWAHAGVDYAVANGLFNGMSSTTFEPGTAMNRAMLVTVLWRYAGQPVEGTNRFTDVENGKWYTRAIAWASANGIVNGVSADRFDPMGKVTREQLATILYRYCGAEGIDSSAQADLSGFPDAGSVSGYAKKAVSWAVAEGIISGNKINGINCIDPKGNATRAQVATIMMRFLENVVKL